MNIENCVVDISHFEDISSKVSKNYMISEFYEDMSWDPFDSFSIRADRVSKCSRFWYYDWYRIQNVRDIKSVNFCHDKFCFNCQSLLAMKRQMKYMPVLDSMFDDYTFCHVVFTVPNCSGDDLAGVIDRMYSNFQFLMRYFSGRKKVKGLNFLKYGYAGALRALEVTYNKDTCLYHPHFHCIFLLRKGIELEPKYRNKYSYDSDSSSVRLFSDFEILLQKVWYLRLNKIEVNKMTVDDLDCGYDVYCEPIQKGQYHEVFKYACKGAFDPDKGMFIYNFEVFDTLFNALFRRRMIQGYGLLFNFNFDDDILSDSVEAVYDDVLRFLNTFESPVYGFSTLENIVGNFNPVMRYISKFSLRRMVNERRNDCDKA